MPPPTAAPKQHIRGVDFSSAPSRRKPITVAHGALDGDLFRLKRIDALENLAAFESLLAEPGPWLAAFDFPFGLPRAFVQSLELGDHIDAVIADVQRRCPTRMDFRSLIDRWGNGRPAGQRLIHRVCDTAEPGVRSSSPLQTRYVPVGFMFYEGLSRLVRANVTLPGLRAGDPLRVGLEGYPGLLAHELIGRRSYKNGDSAEHRAARAEMLIALQAGRTRLGVRVRWPAALGEAMQADAGGDLIDALLCAVQAAWASRRADHGLPAEVDAVEGWITSAGAAR